VWPTIRRNAPGANGASTCSTIRPGSDVGPIC
jgi:hypothetical protein